MVLEYIINDSEEDNSDDNDKYWLSYVCKRMSVVDTDTVGEARKSVMKPELVTRNRKEYNRTFYFKIGSFSRDVNMIDGINNRS